MGNAQKTSFIKARLSARRCDPIGSDDTDSGEVEGVGVFPADKVKGGPGSEMPVETLIWILGESALSTLEALS